MKTWTRAGIDTQCGYCNAIIRRGEPCLELRSDRWRKIRCSQFRCADEAIPSDLPPLVECARLTPALPVRFSAAMLPIDVKLRASGEYACT